jgi:trehalose 6-phosphate phosphatase
LHNGIDMQLMSSPTGPRAAGGASLSTSPPTGLTRQSALFLDVDGTLLDLARTPDMVIVPRGLRGLLRRLYTSLGGAVAVISGRTIADIDRLFAPLRLPAAGQHGAELRKPGTRQILKLVESVLGVLERRRLDDFAEGHDGILIEYKGASIAVHYRLAPRYREPLRRFLLELAAPHRAELSLLEGNMVFELKPQSIDKGTAIARFMALPPFVGRRPVFIGDDTTDEAGFRVMGQLAGEAVRVGARQLGCDGAHLATAGAVRDWLRASLVELQDR